MVALQRICHTLIERFLGQSCCGSLHLALPDGRVRTFGPGGQPEASIQVLRWSLFQRLLWDGDVGLGDGLVAGDWSSPDLTAVIRFFIDNREVLDDRKLSWIRWLARGLGWLRQQRQANSLSGSRRNIRAHYDLGNDLYQAFLGSTMAYSCAVYAQKGDDLDRAQLRKMDMLLDKARLGPHCRLLDLGCGWGSLAIRAAQRTGCSVLGITLSPAQLEFARRAVSQAGLTGQIELRLCDYRELQGSFDRVVSCEMLEAVGHENYPEFFSVLERLVQPDGLVVLQAITVPDFSYAEYRRNQDWIQKAIFPGSLCPALSALLEAARVASRWVLEDLCNIGPHYARTLREWRERFLGAWPQLQERGYDEGFRRTWCYYLSYCEAAFASRNLSVLQLVLTRPKNQLLLQEHQGLF